MRHKRRSKGWLVSTGETVVDASPVSRGEASGVVRFNVLCISSIAHLPHDLYLLSSQTKLSRQASQGILSHEAAHHKEHTLMFDALLRHGSVEMNTVELNID